jgi:SAM-dependent methyltransferase
MRRDWDRRAVDDALYWVYTVHGRQFGDLGFYYDDGARHAREMVAQGLEQWGEGPEGKTLLEVGCGIGRLFPGFEQLGFSRIVGVDVSPEMVGRARRWCPVSNAEFLLVSGDRLAGIGDASIDYCFSYNVFQHMPDSGVFWRNFEEIARALRPGGFMQAQFRGRHGLKRRVARMAPAPLVPAARFLYRSALMRHRRAPVEQPGDPGREQTRELGVAVPPERVSKSLRKMGFADVKVSRDTGYADGRRFWVTGRKAG